MASFFYICTIRDAVAILPAFAVPGAVRMSDDGVMVWDPWRSLWVKATPEEVVRQHLLHWLVEHRHFPRRLLHVEATLPGKPRRRCDAVFYDAALNPVVLVETKAGNVPLEPAMRQIASYAVRLPVLLLLVANAERVAVAIRKSRVHPWEPAYVIPDFGDLMPLSAT